MARENKNHIHEVMLGPLDKVPLGQGFCFVVAADEIAVFRPRTGQGHGPKLCAIANRCPHRNASLAEGVIDSTHVICPYHGHKFNLQTGVGSEPGEKVQVYEVWEEKEELFIKC